MAEDSFVVITSIFEPNEAVRKWAKLYPDKTVVIGDLKSPPRYSCIGVRYISPTAQKKYAPSLSKVLPWNHYSRKMMGYIYAVKNGARYIIDTDDDNIPIKKWQFTDNNLEKIKDNLGFKNIHSYLSSNSDLWPRGYPLQRLNLRSSRVTRNNIDKSVVDAKIGIYQGMVLGEPDIDAIHRLTNKIENISYIEKSVIYGKGTISPFNSQNTVFIRELAPLLYLPSTTTFRATDIVRSYVAQPIIWNLGYNLCFCSPNVKQVRNIHNYISDFESEIPIYLHAEKFFNISARSVKKNKSIAENMLNIYASLADEKLVDKRELPILSAWLDEIYKVL